MFLTIDYLSYNINAQSITDQATALKRFKFFLSTECNMLSLSDYAVIGDTPLLPVHCSSNSTY